jgi:2-aminoadipate transaminase
VSDLRGLFSDLALAGPPLAFAEPPAPVRYNFDAGWPAPESFPVELLAELAREVLEDRAALGYQSVRIDPETGEPLYRAPDFPAFEEMSMGYAGLREQIAAWVGRRQAVPGLDSGNVLLTSGATQAIALAAAAFVNPGEGALVEALTFAWAFRSLQNRRAEVRMVDIDRDGMVIESLEARLEELAREGVRPKLLYVIPTFHLPTGAVLPLERRLRILELAEQWDLVVLEDAIYSDLNFDGVTLPPSLLHLDTSGRVVQSHSFSKIIATGLRLGWLTARKEMIGALAAVREDLGVSQWLSRIVAELMKRGELDPQIERVNAVYRRKRDLAAQGLREHCGDLVEFDLPGGGYFLWVRVDDRVDWDRAKAEAARGGVAVREADRFMLERPAEGGGRHFRLGFAHTTERELTEGTRILGEALRAACRENQPRGQSSIVGAS